MNSKTLLYITLALFGLAALTGLFGIVFLTNVIRTHHCTPCPELDPTATDLEVMTLDSTEAINIQGRNGKLIITKATK